MFILNFSDHNYSLFKEFSRKSCIVLKVHHLDAAGLFGEVRAWNTPEVYANVFFRLIFDLGSSLLCQFTATLY